MIELNIKNSLINDYVSILAEINEWDEINITVDDKFTQNENIARVKIFVSLGEEGSNTGVILKLVNNIYSPNSSNWIPVYLGNQFFIISSFEFILFCI